MDFGEALNVLKRGGRVTRSGWNGQGQFLEMQFPDRHSKMTLPYIYISTVDGRLVPWLASQTDMLAHDWCCPGQDRRPMVMGQTATCDETPSDL